MEADLRHTQPPQALAPRLTQRSHRPRSAISDPTPVAQSHPDRRPNFVRQPRGVEFLRAGARPATAVVVEFIDAHRDRFGVEPICRVLTEHGCGIAPSTYYAAKTRPASARSLRDEIVLAHIRRVHGSPRIGRGLYGARKVSHELGREQARGEHLEVGAVPRCQVERLMRGPACPGLERGARGFTEDVAIWPTPSEVGRIRHARRFS